MTRTAIERDPKLEAARARLESVAVQLCTRLDGLDVASTFAAIGATLLVEMLGRDRAVSYLRDLAAELAEDTDSVWGGRA